MLTLALRLRIALVFALLLGAAAPAAAQHEQVQALASRVAGEISKAGAKRVVVTNFAGPQEGFTQLGKVFSLEFSAALAWTGAAFDVQHSPALQAALREAGPTPKNMDVFDDRVVTRLGQISGADVIVTGIFGLASDHVELSVRAANAATGATITQATGSIPVTPVMKDLLARQLVPAGIVPGANPAGGAPPTPAFHDGGYEPNRNGVTTAKCISCPNPQYTDAARSAKIRGTIILRFLVLEDGTPSRISMVRGLGYGLDDEAIRTLTASRFTPATDASGKPVPVWQTVEYTFNLM
jgi:TonB family protein